MRSATACLLASPSLFVALLTFGTRPAQAASPRIVSLTKIWDAAEHSAFTDLIRFQDKWWCTFREAKGHGASVGKVRVIVSSAGDDWQSAALLEDEEIDLRDPKLSITPNGRLMLIMGGIVYDGSTYVTRAPRVAFSSDGREWTSPRKLLAEDHWLWRVTWHQGHAYSISKLGEGRDPRRGMLYSSADGIQWDWVTEFRLPNNTWNASETTLRFLDDETMVALVRPEWIGTSQPPYKNWKWTRIGHRLGGPNFLEAPDGTLWASSRGRDEDGQSKTVLARMTPESFEPVLTLPSGGDTSYAGMVWHEGLLWMSYYSSHEGKASIYLAKISLAP